jgi:hypothetical protein
VEEVVGKEEEDAKQESVLSRTFGRVLRRNEGKRNLRKVKFAYQK